jgi:hypothetical protein
MRGDPPSDEQRDAMIDRLYEPFGDNRKETPVDPFESTSVVADTANGLGKAVVRHKYHVSLHISDRLYSQQPIGVLLGPINDAVRKKGEAMITDTTPRSAEVEEHIMPAEHMKLKIEPLPLWFDKFVGEDGYGLF